MFSQIFNSKKRIAGLAFKDWLFVFGGVLVFSVITLLTITKYSLWFDEAFGTYLINFNFLDVAKYTAADVHPPFYYWLLKIWSFVFGHSELGLRSMSLFFGCVTIIFGYLLLNKLFNKKVARFSLIFMVLSPMMIRYSQEARMYTLVAAITMAATYVLTFTFDTKKRWPWITYGILVSLGMWTHYFSALVWLTHWLWRADVVRRTVKKGEFLRQFLTKDWVTTHVLAVILFVPWLPFLAYQLGNVQYNGFWIPAVTPDTMMNFITNVAYYLDVDQVTGWLALGLLLLIIILGVLTFKIYKKQHETERQAYRLVLSLAFLPMILLFVASMPPFRPAFVDRYLIPTTFGIALFVGVTLALSDKIIGKKYQIILTIVTVGVLVFGVFGVVRLGNYNKTLKTSNNTRQIVEAIKANSDTNQPIISDSPWLFYEVVFYENADHPVYFINEKTDYRYGALDMLKCNSQHKIVDIDSFTQSNPIVWYVGRPGEGAFKEPYANWQKVKEVSIKDSVSGKMAYRAIQYRVAEN